MSFSAAEELALLEAAYQRRLAGGVVESWRVGGADIRYCSIAELNQLLQNARNRVAMEDGTTALVDFVDPQGGATPAS